jgi:CheY-like chemotaxis protein
MITIQAGYALVIDDEPSNRDFLERLLQTASFKVLGASSGAEALKAARSVPELALALVDQQLPDSTGLEIIARLRAENPETLLIMATMHDDRTLIDEAFVKGADVFLVKPHGFMELYRRLKGVDSNIGLLRRLVIDQYGPRPYKGTGQLRMQTTPPVTLGPGVTRPHRPTGPLPPLPASKPPSVAPAPPASTGGTNPAASPAQPATSSERKGSEETVARRPAPGPGKPDAKPAV